MQGYNVLWMPGTDHAGIATQHVVEKELIKEGLTRYDLGREEFLERVWAWKDRYGSQIIDQMKRLGCSCDWERERFTMDGGYSEAVRETFCRLYEKGLIYRGEYIVNWCPGCQTALSDIEVEHQEEPGYLYYIRYCFKDSRESIQVATTRPETMLGDTAVAVNPSDSRYKHLIGKSLILPIVGREIPLIGDDYVDPEFGTGIVKITPAHDPNDFEIGRRHGLSSVAVIDTKSMMTKEAGGYAGLDRYECREKLLQELKREGYLEKVEDYLCPVGRCYRCQTAIEPLISEQWFLRTSELAKPAIEAVKEGRVRCIPDRWTSVYLQWMENLRDWCISRQIWWSHKIPVWYCVKKFRIQNSEFRIQGQNSAISHSELPPLARFAREARRARLAFGGRIPHSECPPIVARTKPAQCPKCGNRNLVQDPDVLDTWFSSALWPFSTLGWPRETRELKYFYPTNCLVTGHEIIFLWVARMITMGLELVGEIPFRDVYIHGIVRDVRGKKMSKSLGNVIDPLDVIDQYGCDALRFTLAAQNIQGRDLQLSPERFEANRNFANKIWNVSRFVLMNLEDFEPDTRYQIPDTRYVTLADRWILGRYNRLVKRVTDLIEDYNISEVARILYEFIWHEYCDWYAELAKPRLYQKADPASRKIAQYVLWHVLEGILRLIHPLMPFITEEIWQRLPHRVAFGSPVAKSRPFGADGADGREDSIMVASWPEYDEGLEDLEATNEMELIMDLTHSIRNIRSEFGLAPAKKIKVFLKPGTEEEAQVLKAHSSYISDLARLSSLGIGLDLKNHQPSTTRVTRGIEIWVPMAGLIDIVKERDGILDRVAKIDKELGLVGQKLKNVDFLIKAPRMVVDKARKRKEELIEARVKLEENLARLKEGL
jgi:valyl-tRNA synthetase